MKAKHWQVFSLFAACYIFTQFFKADTLIVGCVFLALLVMYVGYYALLGNTLFQYLPRKLYFNITWLILDAFVVIAAYASSMMFFDGNLELNGFAAIPGLYLFFALGHLFWFPAVTLVAIETKTEPTFSQYGGTMLQLFFWPVGIWFVQPRLSRIYDAVQADTLDYPCP